MHSICGTHINLGFPRFIFDNFRIDMDELSPWQNSYNKKSSKQGVGLHHYQVTLKTSCRAGYTPWSMLSISLETCFLFS